MEITGFEDTAKHPLTTALPENRPPNRNRGFFLKTEPKPTDLGQCETVTTLPRAKVTIDNLQEVVYEKLIGVKMDDLHLCLEVIQGHVNYCDIDISKTTWARVVGT